MIKLNVITIEAYWNNINKNMNWRRLDKNKFNLKFFKQEALVNSIRINRSIMN